MTLVFTAVTSKNNVTLCKLDVNVKSVGHLTRMSGDLGSIPGLATYFRFSFRFFKRVSYWRKYVHKVLVNRLGGLSLPRKSVVRSTDRPDMTLDVYSLTEKVLLGSKFFFENQM